MLWSRPSVARKEEEQRRIKAELLLEATKLLGVDALGVGDGDLAFGVDFLLEHARRLKLPYVSANIGDGYGTLVLPDVLIVEKAGKKFGITSVMLEQTGVVGVTVLPPIPALEAAVAKLRAQGVDFVLLLSHLGYDEDVKLHEKVPGIDLIVGGHTRKQAEDPTIIGGTAVVQCGSRGKFVGELRIDLRDGATGWADPGAAARIEAQRASFELQLKKYEEQVAAADGESQKKRLERVTEFTRQRLAELVVPPLDDGTHNVLHSTKIAMDSTLGDDERMAALVNRYLERLGPENVDPIKAALHPEKPQGDFVGAPACKSCHESQYVDWIKTPHARAYGTLVKERRHFDVDCWSCHVTGAGQPGGPSGPGAVGALKNVQCESCHGPGRAHVADPKVGVKNTFDEAFCKTCHSDEQTEGRFEFQKYLADVDHR